MTLPLLPVTDVLPALHDVLRTKGTCILEAPPGAGKTTLVPLSIANDTSLGTGTILLLEPRRVAARAAARRMAALLGEDVGSTVGYRLRMESKVSSITRIEVVTEGILTRRLASAPECAGVSCIIFDEFHERSIHADTALGLALLTRSLFRPDLRIVVMSATLSSLSNLSALVAPDMADVTVRSIGVMFPVETIAMRRPPEKPLPDTMAAAVRDALAAHSGDILCFLPGMADINRTAERLGHIDDADVLPLHGDLGSAAQDAILLPSPQGRRKVILATSIAETSLTFDGVRVVIDGGKTREPRFDARSGMTRLVTVNVSADAAEQRRGRAGRLAPGTCYRLWTEADHSTLEPRRTPEILTSDLAPMLLDLAAYGVTLDDLPLLDPPPPFAVAMATALLTDLGAITQSGMITEFGRLLASLGIHPRLGAMLSIGRRLGLPPSTLAAVASLAAERDVLRSVRDASVHRRVAALDGHSDPDIEKGALAQARRQMAVLRDRVERLPAGPTVSFTDPVSVSLALAYPDRIARQKQPGRFLLANGRTATVHQHDPLGDAQWLAIGDADATGGMLAVRVAGPLTEDDVRTIAADRITEETVFGIDEQQGLVVARRCTRLGAITLDERDDPTATDEQCAHALASWAVERQWRDLRWNDEGTSLLHRLLFLMHNSPDTTALTMLESILPATILATYLVGKRRLKDVAALDAEKLLRAHTDWATLQRLEAEAPKRVTLARGRTVMIDYADPHRPTIASRLQDFFGTLATPLIGPRKIPLTIHLLSPAGRPVQVTQDLEGFWRGSYADVRKEMRGRYPKHAWPEHPERGEL